jgi:hypothetical protein
MYLSDQGQRDQLAQSARQRDWGLSLLLVGWLHLFAFAFCYYLTIQHGYHEAPGYLLVWIAELCGMWLIFRICGGQRPAATTVPPLELAVRRVWTAYFFLAFNLGSLNALRGHQLFEFFPAVASLASFAFLMMAMLVHRWFFAAVLVMFVSGLLMAANLLHAYLVFAISWWLVLSGIGSALWFDRRNQAALNSGIVVRAHVPLKSSAVKS